MVNWERKSLITYSEKSSKIPIPLKISFQVEKDREAAEQLATEIKSQLAEVQQQVTSAFVAIGEGLGDFAATGNIRSLFAPGLNLISSYLKQMGESAIEAGVVMLGLKKALSVSFSNPALSITAGIALIAASQLIKSKLSGIQPFAQGGLVFGPTLGLVGEGVGTSRSNPEVIAPLSQLMKYINKAGGQQVVIPDVKISGSDLVLVFNRANQSQRRNFGR